MVQTLYLQTEVELLERSPYLGRKPVHALALLERDDHVRSPVFHRNLGHYLLHDERVWQTADDVVQDRLYLHVENNERDITWPRSFLASVRRDKNGLIPRQNIAMTFSVEKTRMVSAIAAILFCWIRIKAVQQLTVLTCIT